MRTSLRRGIGNSVHAKTGKCTHALTLTNVKTILRMPTTTRTQFNIFLELVRSGNVNTVIRGSACVHAEGASASGFAGITRHAQPAVRKQDVSNVLEIRLVRRDISFSDTVSIYKHTQTPHNSQRFISHKHIM